VWGTHDPLIPHGFKRHVEKWLPKAEQVVFENCGHVPQVERPAETNALLEEFFERADARIERRRRRDIRLAAA
jgi:pimeloyl-ACP methyl ester carboxylesterase